MMEWTPQSADQKKIQSVNPLTEILMNENDIELFMKAFDDFMQHSETAIEEHKNREEARLFYERKAAEHEVTVDYYLQEFV
jgi:hypothetical protein